MQIDAHKMICMHNRDSDKYCCYIDSMPGVIVQVDTLEDAPKELAKIVEIFLKMQMKKGIHIVKTYN